jgi:hypothetical protein
LGRIRRESGSGPVDRAGPSITSKRPAETDPQGGVAPVPPKPARERFRELDRYRVEREWKRYEGTPQRALFRELRERFLDRHAHGSGPALEVGPGPGRFTTRVGGTAGERVLLDLSREALGYVRDHWASRSPEAPPALVLGDVTRPPFRPNRFRTVVALGNPLGFAESAALDALRGCLSMVAEGGTIVLEAVVGPGERSRYLTRLPTRATARLLRAPVAAVRPRVEREGFAVESRVPRPRQGFRRFSVGELRGLLEREGIEIVEALSVAPLLGLDPERVRAVSTDPKAWGHLLELEEEIGRTEGRRGVAASLLIAGVLQRSPRRPPPPDKRD